MSTTSGVLYLSKESVSYNTAVEEFTKIPGINILKFGLNENDCYVLNFKDLEFNEKNNNLVSRNLNVIQKCRHIPSNKTMVIKQISIPFHHCSYIDSSVKHTASPKSKREKLKLEITIHQSFGFSENIIDFYGFAINENKIWIFLEYMDMSLTDLYLKQHNECYYFPLSLLGYAAVQTLNGLNQIQEHKVIHRDIKPSNILFNEETGEVKICDFGEAIYINNQNSVTNFGGTLQYMPPEIFELKINEDKIHDDRLDVWSLGITLVELILKHNPFIDPLAEAIIEMVKIPTRVLENDNLKMISDYYQKKELYFKRVNGTKKLEELKEFLASCLEKNYNSRNHCYELKNQEFYKNHCNITKNQITILWPNEKKQALENINLLKDLVDNAQMLEGNMPVCHGSDKELYENENSTNPCKDNSSTTSNPNHLVTINGKEYMKQSINDCLFVIPMEYEIIDIISNSWRGTIL